MFWDHRRSGCRGTSVKFKPTLSIPNSMLPLSSSFGYEGIYWNKWKKLGSTYQTCHPTSTCKEPLREWAQRMHVLIHWKDAGIKSAHRPDQTQPNLGDFVYLNLTKNPYSINKRTDQKSSSSTLGAGSFCPIKRSTKATPSLPYSLKTCFLHGIVTLPPPKNTINQ